LYYKGKGTIVSLYFQNRRPNAEQCPFWSMRQCTKIKSQRNHLLIWPSHQAYN
jgi:hypothetical protein